MFAGNPQLRGDGEGFQMEAWQLDELRKCVRDPVYFANKYVKITTKDKGIQLFSTWDFQSDLIKTMKENRFVVAKFPRQCGKCICYTELIDVKFPDGSIEKISVGDLFELLKEMESSNGVI
jgi:hypothetical protein